MFLPLYDSNKIAHIAFPYVNYGLLIVTILVFTVQFAGGTAGLEQAHIEYGMIPVVVRDVVEGPAPWLPDQATLFSYMFLHADLFHLLSNMLFLWVFGDNVEDALGHVKYLAFYLLCGVLAGVVHLFIYPDSYGPLVGASGAVAGVMGAYLVLYPRVRVFVLNRLVIFFPLALPAWAVLGIWIFSQLFYAVLGSDGAVAWWAHIGGVAAGAALVFLFRRLAPGPSIEG
ncbi:rhomboid family intramembrane serine protease [Pelagibacterium sediminicola]|uniref:rhomboid family intramembrane serine protease n=1 Tax=Pelagibacterium sediminicola TaxID=2248761 RepID=UPI000E322AD6|nr:rhomboid family intramembrane serine protease [Pelagibacterium sediminicola]